MTSKDITNRTARLPPACNKGKREEIIILATGAILPVWKNMITTVFSTRSSSGKGEKALRVVQAETDATSTEPAKRIVGMQINSDKELSSLRASLETISGLDSSDLL